MCLSSDSVYANLHSIYRVTSADWVQDYFEVINMDQASTSIECMIMPSNESGCHVSELHRVSLKNPSIFMWVNFVICVLTCIMADFVIMYFGLVYICNVLYHIYVWKCMKYECVCNSEYNIRKENCKGHNSIRRNKDISITERWSVHKGIFKKNLVARSKIYYFILIGELIKIL